VTLIRLSKDEKLQAVERMDASIEDDEAVVDVVAVVADAAPDTAAPASDETPQG
jgi:DNA gyrase subunit A